MTFKNLTQNEKCLLNTYCEMETGLSFETLYANYLARVAELQNLKNDIGELIDEIERKLK